MNNAFVSWLNDVRANQYVARNGEGAGLGLSIVANLCEKMGASVEAHLEGDELTITLTLAE